MKTRIFNSTIFLLTAYYLVHFTYLGTQYFFLKILGVKNVELYFFYNAYLAPENSWWERYKVFLIFGGGLVFLLLLILIIGVLFIKLSRKKYKMHSFYTWVLLVAFSFLIAEFFSAAFYGNLSNLHSVMLWMHFQSGGGGMYVIAILFLLLIPLIGFLSYGNFIKMSNTTQYIRTKGSRVKFYFKTAILPFIILSLIILIMANIVYSYDVKYIISREVMRLSMLGIILFFGAIFSFNKKYISIQKSNTSHVLDLSLSMFLSVGMLAIFFVLFLNLR